MDAEKNSEKNMDSMLLQESVWKIEDRVNIIQESMADHEAELIRLKRLSLLVKERLDKLEGSKNIAQKNNRNGQ